MKRYSNVPINFAEFDSRDSLLLQSKTLKFCERRKYLGALKKRYSW